MNKVSLFAFLTLAVSCETKPVPVEPVAIKASSDVMPAEPHTHAAPAPLPAATEYKIPGDQKTVQLSKPITDITCDDYENLAKLACLFPNQKVPFPICQTDDSYALEGVIPYVLCSGNSDLIDIGMAYAKSSYAPSTIGQLVRTKGFVEHQSVVDTRPLLYTKGVTGEDAHILMTSIWSEWKITGTFTAGMKTVIEEQAKRQPDCLYYQYIHDAAQNSFEGSIKLASGSRSNCDYFAQMDDDEKPIDIVFTQSQLVKALK